MFFCGIFIRPHHFGDKSKSPKGEIWMRQKNGRPKPLGKPTRKTETRPKNPDSSFADMDSDSVNSQVYQVEALGLRLLQDGFDKPSLWRSCTIRPRTKCL